VSDPLKFDPFELRLGMPLEAKASAEGVVEGLASTFGGDPDAYGDLVAPGAFSASLARHSSEGTAPSFLWAHDPGRIVGKWERLEERADGLHVAGRLNLRTEAGREAFEHLRAGDLDGLSIGFRIPRGGSSIDGKTGLRTLTAIDLFEISAVAMPANRRARVRHVKSFGCAAELRELLREAGLPHRAAEKIALAGFAALGGRDPAELEAEAKAAAEADLLKSIAAELRRFNSKGGAR
jgi:HK97 family phage prohead protease